MSSTIKVSIIIPVYNVERYIGACLDSIYEQSYSNIEVILVDDCGTDNSMVVAGPYVERLRTRFDVLIVNRPCNGGLARARNGGIDVASGDYLFFLDSDDTLAIDAIERFVDGTVGNEICDVVVGRIVVVGNRCGRPFPVLGSGVIDGSEQIMGCYFNRLISSTACNMLINRRFFDAGLRFGEGLLHEDELFTFSLILRCNVLVSIDCDTYFYLQHEGAITSSFGKANLLDNIKIQQLKVVDLLSVGIAPSLYGRAYSYFAGMVYWFAFRLVSGSVRGVERGEFGEYFSIFRDLISQVTIFASNGISFKARIIKFILSLHYRVGYFFIRIHTLIGRK